MHFLPQESNPVTNVEEFPGMTPDVSLINTSEGTESVKTDNSFFPSEGACNLNWFYSGLSVKSSFQGTQGSVVA